MGVLHYGAGVGFSFDDRTLTHLRSVIFAKLSLQESLAFTWVDGGRQRTIWLTPTAHLHFEFEEAVTPELNPEWIEQLLALANSAAGLRLIDEPRGRTSEA